MINEWEVRSGGGREIDMCDMVEYPGSFVGDFGRVLEMTCRGADSWGNTLRNSCFSSSSMDIL